jgi:hypothetical protein
MSVTSDRLRERIHALRRSDPCPFTTHPGTTLPTGAVVRLEAGAGQLYLSPYTVRDHIKAILDRAGSTVAASWSARCSPSTRSSP